MTPRGTGIPRSNETGLAACTRRSFLGLLLAGCTQLRRSALSSHSDPTTALISDVHVSALKSKSSYGSNMAANLERAVRDCVALGPDDLVFNGDVAFREGMAEDYATFELIARPVVESGARIHWTIGNHDDRRQFIHALHPGDRSQLTDRYAARVLRHGMAWVFLDSLDRVNGIPGKLGAEQLDWLERTLDQDRGTPTVVFVHHNPDDVLLGLQDGPALCDIVESRRQVKIVIFGHTHLQRCWQSGGLHYLDLPATGYRFRLDAELGWTEATWKSGGMQYRIHTVENAPRILQPRTLTWRGSA